MAQEQMTEAEEDAREVLRQACIDGGCMSEGEDIPSEIPYNVAIAAIILESMIR